MIKFIKYLSLIFKIFLSFLLNFVHIIFRPIIDRELAHVALCREVREPLLEHHSKNVNVNQVAPTLPNNPIKMTKYNRSKHINNVSTS